MLKMQERPSVRHASDTGRPDRRAAGGPGRRSGKVRGGAVRTRNATPSARIPSSPIPVYALCPLRTALSRHLLRSPRLPVPAGGGSSPRPQFPPPRVPPPQAATPWTRPLYSTVHPRVHGTKRRLPELLASAPASSLLCENQHSRSCVIDIMFSAVSVSQFCSACDVILA